MNDELEKALAADFPLLYGKGLIDGCFRCGGGWEPLIRNLSKTLEPLISAIPPQDRPHAIQVKEKFGTLRFYISHGTDEMFDAISLAEGQSAAICEKCGCPGKLRRVTQYWVQTRCDNHV